MSPAETPNAVENAVIISRLDLKIALKIKLIINKAEKHIKKFSIIRVIRFPPLTKKLSNNLVYYYAPFRSIFNT